MKCELCNGTGVINTALTGHTPTTPCPNCDHGNLQLRLDHNFQPVLERMEDKRELSPTQQRTEEAYIAAQVEAWGREPNPLLAELPFITAGSTLQNQDWTHGQFNVVPERRLNAFIEGKPVSDDEAREYQRKHPNLMLMPLSQSEQKANEFRGLSAPPRRCNQDLRLEGKPYPRTCAECGLGPCKWPLQPGDEQAASKRLKTPPAVQEFNEKRGACSRCIGTGWVQVAGSTSPCPKCRRVVLSKLGGAFEFDSYSIIERDAYDSFKPGRDVA